MASSIKVGRKHVMVGLLLFSALAIAGTVIVNGRQFTCENTCKVGVTDHGWYVYDSEGGWLREDAVNDSIDP